MAGRGVELDLFQGALTVGVRHLPKGEYFAAYRSFLRAAALAEGEADRELARGLVHLAAAGHKLRLGDVRGYERQLARARRRLTPFLPSTRGLDLVRLLELVGRDAR